jgi:predicted NBD/HSP70 family sugar kinase
LETYASLRVLRELPGEETCVIAGQGAGDRPNAQVLDSAQTQEQGQTQGPAQSLQRFQTPADMLVRFEHGDVAVRRVLLRAVDSVLLAISNMSVLFDPSVVVMYGDWFASGMFRDSFMEHVATGYPDLVHRVQISSHNLELDECMACALAVHQYLQCGAIKEGNASR